MSLDTAHLLALMTNSAGTSLDAQDGDGLVQLAFESYPEGQKDAIIQRIAEHLVPNDSSSAVLGRIDIYTFQPGF